jgi:regulator of protease activity HflC (stomatin/prohibitin superfamily)
MLYKRTQLIVYHLQVRVDCVSSVTYSVTVPLAVVVDVENEVSVLVPIVLDSVDVVEVSASVDELLLDSRERETTLVPVVRTLVRVLVVVPGVVP